MLEDAVVIRITRPQNGTGPRVKWQLTTKALADVELGRTPIPGEPGGLGHGGYGGFSWRGSKEFKYVSFTDSEGRKDSATHRQRARWINLTGLLNGKPAGLTVIDHPSNPGHPASWYVVPGPLEPFWYVSPALVQPKPITLQKGDSFTHTYQVTVHDGGWQAAECDREAQIFGGPRPKP